MTFPSERRSDPAGAGAPGEVWARLMRRLLFKEKKGGVSHFSLLKAPSVPTFPFLKGTPLTGPPPSLLLPSFPTAVLLFSSRAPTQPPPPGSSFSSSALGRPPVNHRRLGAPAGLLSASRALGVPGAPVSASLRSVPSRGDLSAELAEGGSRPGRRSSGYR